MDVAAASQSLGITAAFLTGVVGGLGHCTLMCGGIVLAVGELVASLPTWRRRTLMALAHLGRWTTYLLLALALHALGDLGPLAPWRRLWLALLGGAALLFAWRLLRPVPVTGTGSGSLGRWIARRLRALRGGGVVAAGLAGMAWGLLPCMFSGALILGAAAAPTAPQAVGILFAFGAGTTLPLLLVDRLGGLLRRRAGLLRRLTALLLLLWGAVILYRALG